MDEQNGSVHCTITSAVGIGCLRTKADGHRHGDGWMEAALPYGNGYPN